MTGERIQGVNVVTAPTVRVSASVADLYALQQDDMFIAGMAAERQHSLDRVQWRDTRTQAAQIQAQSRTQWNQINAQVRASSNEIAFAMALPSALGAGAGAIAGALAVPAVANALGSLGTAISALLPEGAGGALGAAAVAAGAGFAGAEFYKGATERDYDALLTGVSGLGGGFELGAGSVAVGYRASPWLEGVTAELGGVPNAATPTNTGTVWDSINPTQDVYAGTQIPRSFTLSTDGADVWVAPNASEHMAEYALGNSGSAGGFSPELVNLNSQVQLTSLQAAVGDATANGVQYGTLVNQGDWELIFSPPRQPGQLPALIHALPNY